MKKILRYALVIAAIAYTTIVKAQTHPGDKNNVNPNTSYKDQIPVSKGNKFKDSFRNDQIGDVTEGNYKQQLSRKQKRGKPPVKQNFDRSNGTNNINSKHPYGL